MNSYGLCLNYLINFLYAKMYTFPIEYFIFLDSLTIMTEPDLSLMTPNTILIQDIS